MAREEHLDDKTCQDVSISSMMLVSELVDGEIRFDCTICMRRYKHHPSLFRHFKSVHKKLYEQKVALREKLKAEREALKILGLPYLRRRNQKRKMSRKDGGSGCSPPSSKPRLEIPTENTKENEEHALQGVSFSCPRCLDMFSSHMELSQHASQCKDETNVTSVPSNLDPFVEYLVRSNEIFVCLICGIDLGNMERYVMHMNEEHGRSALCSPDYDNMIAVDLLEEEQRPSILDKGYYFCDACGEFVNLDSFSPHRCDIDSILKVYNII